MEDGWHDALAFEQGAVWQVTIVDGESTGATTTTRSAVYASRTRFAIHDAGGADLLLWLRELVATRR